MGVLNINTFEPFSKNPTISKVFREIGYADELGSGMRNSYKFTRLYSGAEPEFIEGDVFKIIIPLTTGAMTKVGPGTDIENHTETTQNHTETTQNDLEIIDISMSTGLCDVELDIVRLIKENPHISIREMTEKTEWTQWQIRYYVDRLKKNGVLKREGAQKKGKWIILEPPGSDPFKRN